MGNKRKNALDVEGNGHEKRAKADMGVAGNPKEKGSSHTNANRSGPLRKPETQPNPHRRPRIRKLAPPRPFPTVASASAASGPRTAHQEGKNNICITRKTKLAAYLRRCKALFVDDGFKELRLSAMGAAIPHLALLAVSLPPILPWAEDEVHVDVFTGSLEVHDEVLSESGSEAEDGPPEEFRTRVKSTMNIIIRVGRGETCASAEAPGSPLLPAKNASGQTNGIDADSQQGGERIVLQEPEQDGMETS